VRTSRSSWTWQERVAALGSAFCLVAWSGVVAAGRDQSSRMASGSAWRFAVVGDTHVAAADLAGELAASMVEDGVDLVLFPGDIVQAGLGVSGSELRDELSAWKDAVAPLHAAGIGIYPVRGNHEADAPDILAAWSEAFSGAFALPTDGPAGEEGLTYSFTHKNAIFVGLDDYVSLHRVNQGWLDSRLALRPGLPHLFVFGHEPAFEVNHTDCLDDDPAARDAFWRSLAAAGAGVYLCGHDHFFDAARIVDGGVGATTGLVQLVVGTGGGDLFSRHGYDGENSGFLLSALSHLETNGYILVEISGEGEDDLVVTLTFKERIPGDGGTPASYVAAYTYRYVAGGAVVSPGSYPVVDTGQAQCYDAATAVACPSPGLPFYGQDTQHGGKAPSFTVSADGLTVRDEVTGLTWQKSPDTNGDGVLDSADKLTYPEALARPSALNAAAFGGFDDWRVPSIKELYSLIDFRGTDPMVQGTNTAGLTPFVDCDHFDFVYGDPGVGERIIDAQYWSATTYVSTTMGGSATQFGVNFADGRIKGYSRDAGPGGTANRQFLRCVRGNQDYGQNAFVDNGDGTVTDAATGLMWSKEDSGTAMSWQEALAWVEARNAEGFLGHADWRLPDAKELQSILDYTRSPDTSGSAAIDPVLSCTAITNEGGAGDHPWYWSSTTHVASTGSAVSGVYVCFGRALGWMRLQGASCYTLLDVHGAGAQRSDPKSGAPASCVLGTACTGGPVYGRGPQGDVVRVENFARLVRDAEAVSPPPAQGRPIRRRIPRM
jgi:hypothetical protein